jgi:hypothetical protein
MGSVHIQGGEKTANDDICIFIFQGRYFVLNPVLIKEFWASHAEPLPDKMLCNFNVSEVIFFSQVIF